jgi:hypothetical protein
MWPFLAASLKELITRDPLGRPMRALVQKLNIFGTTVSKDVAGGLAIQILCYEERSICVRALTARKRALDWLKKNPLGGVGLPANLTMAFWTIFCGASLSYRSMQSLTTKSRTCSRR